MKLSAVLFIIMFPVISYGQYLNGFLRENFFGRQPSARAEAMGKSYASIDGDLSSIFFNPAGTASIKGLEVKASFASPFYYAEDLKYNFFGAAYHFNKYLSVGFSRNQINYGMLWLTSPVYPGPVDSGIVKNNIYTLNISSQPFKNVLIGINANYMVYDILMEKPTLFHIDFGIIKKFKLKQNKNTQQSVNIGASLCNLNNTEMSIKNIDETSEIIYFSYKLPVICRIAANYQIAINKHLLIDTLNTIELLAQAEYNDLLNSDYETSYHFGAEVKLLEILSLRTGYYHQKVYDYLYLSTNKDFISSFTYGFGVQIPLHKLCKIPLKINFDYTSLTQPTYVKNKSDWDNFTTYTCSLNWCL